jgi:hypothetical protein
MPLIDTLQTDHGDLLYVRSQGVRHGSAEVLARLGRGEEVDASEYVFRTSTQIETAAADFDWLNKGVFISVAGRQPAGVIPPGLPRGMNPSLDSQEEPASSPSLPRVAIITGGPKGIATGPGLVGV